MIENIHQAKLIDVLPPSVLEDKKLKASAEALDAELEKLAACVKETLHLPRLDELNSDVLDYLAWQWHVDGYDTTFDNDTKRKMIRESIYLHRIKGTPAAVEKAAKAMLADAVIEENWEYGGKPYFFRILASGLNYYGDDGEKFLRVIYAAKNVRSWLEDITIDLTVPDDYQKLFHAIAEVDGGNVTTENETTEENQKQTPEYTQKLFHAMAEISGGETITEYDGEEIGRNKIVHAVAELDYGNEVIDIDRPPPPDVDNIVAHYLLARMKFFWKNPVVQFYCEKSHYHSDAIDINDDDDDDEIFPDGDFIRLYFKFADCTVKTLTLLNPRDDVSVSELQYIGTFTAENFVLKNFAGFYSTGLKKAMLISKKKFKLI